MSDIEQYNYALPRELIAQFPLAERADARLMTIDREQNTIRHGHVRDLPELLCDGDCLVLNDTRVLPAALRGRRDRTGGRWSGLFLRADEHGVCSAACRRFTTIKTRNTSAI